MSTRVGVGVEAEDDGEEDEDGGGSATLKETTRPGTPTQPTVVLLIRASEAGEALHISAATGRGKGEREGSERTPRGQRHDNANQNKKKTIRFPRKCLSRDAMNSRGGFAFAGPATSVAANSRSAEVPKKERIFC